jgi:hypothetical protein
MTKGLKAQELAWLEMVKFLKKFWPFFFYPRTHIPNPKSARSVAHVCDFVNNLGFDFQKIKINETLILVFWKKNKDLKNLHFLFFWQLKKTYGFHEWTHKELHVCWQTLAIYKYLV